MRKFGIAVAALLVGLALGVAANASFARSGRAELALENVMISSYVVGSPFRGTVFAAKQGSQVGVQLSLHRLTPDFDYAVAGSSKPCRIVDAADHLIWRVDIRTGPAANDTFRTMTVARDGPLAGQRSTRIYSIVRGDALNQLACTASEPVGFG